MTKAFDDVCADLGIQDSVADLVAACTTKHQTRTSRSIETTGITRLRPFGGGVGAADFFDAELCETSTQSLRVQLAQTLIVGDHYQVESLDEEGEPFRRVMRCVSCRLKEGERFDAELRNAAG